MLNEVTKISNTDKKTTDWLASQTMTTRDLKIRFIMSQNKERMESTFYTIRDGSVNGYC